MERTPHSSSRHKALVDFALPLAFLVLASLVAWAYPQLLESGGMRGPVVVAGEASKGYATTVTYLLIAAIFLPLVVAYPPTSPEASRVYIEGPLRFLVSQGFTDHDAGQLFEAVFALSFGHALLTTNYPAIEAEGVPPVSFTEESFEHTVRVLIDGYSGERGGM